MAVRMRVNVDETNVGTIRQHASDLSVKIEDICVGDTVDVDYAFEIDYLGGVEKRLDAVASLLPMAHSKTVELAVLNKGRSVIVELLRKIDAVIALGNE